MDECGYGGFIISDEEFLFCIVGWVDGDVCCVLNFLEVVVVYVEGDVFDGDVIEWVMELGGVWYDK